MKQNYLQLKKIADQVVHAYSTYLHLGDKSKFKEVAPYYEEAIVTEISPLGTFYEAEEYHQDYYRNNQSQGYCSAVISPKLSKLRKMHADKIKKTKV